MLKIGFLASGRGSNFQAIVDAVNDGTIKAEPALLVSDKADAHALKRAHEQGIENKFMDPGGHETSDAYYEAVASEMKARGVGLVVLAGFMRMVRKPLLDAFSMKVMNIHPALLPSFPGLHGHGDALEYGVKLSGCTVHFVDEGMDTGPIIIQAAVPIYDDDTEEALSERILKLEHRIFPEAIRLFAEGRLEVHGRRVKIRAERKPDESIINPPLVA
jgi:phosphoribosylglycinamide formyltransferase-1